MGRSYERGQGIGRLAVAVGLVAYASLASLVVFFVVGNPFGTLSDLGNASVGILSGLLAWTLRPRAVRAPSGTAAIGAAVLGAGIAVVGSALIVSGTTGPILAGLVSSLGFAFIGVWLTVVSRAMSSDVRWPRRLPTLGVVAGAVMAIGFVAIPGIAMGVDDVARAPWWVWLGFLGWLGAWLLYPAWAIWLGRALLRGAMSVETERQT